MLVPPSSGIPLAPRVLHPVVLFPTRAARRLPPTLSALLPLGRVPRLRRRDFHPKVVAHIETKHRNLENFEVVDMRRVDVPQ